jgi:hypothetical protein
VKSVKALGAISFGPHQCAVYAREITESVHPRVGERPMR